MIKSFANSRTRKVFEDERTPNAFAGLDLELALRRLDMLEAAGSLDDISPLRSVNLHQLKGDRAGQWAMNINGRWRLVFEWDGEGACNVEITDYHKG